MSSVVAIATNVKFPLPLAVARRVPLLRARLCIVGIVVVVVAVVVLPPPLVPRKRPVVTL